MIEWFDSHCHVDEEAFDADREEALARMRENGVTRFAVIGSDMETSRRAIAFAAAHRDCAAVGGIHPHEASGFREEDLEEIQEPTDLHLLVILHYCNTRDGYYRGDGTRELLLLQSKPLKQETANIFPIQNC